MGIHLNIVVIREEELDKDLCNKLYNQGIRNLPTLITHNGKKYVGLRKIQTLFDNNAADFRRMGGMQMRRPQQEQHAEIGTNADLADFYAKELKDDGKDDSIDEFNKDDMERKMRNWMSNPPKHHHTSRKSLTNNERREEPKDNFGPTEPAAESIDMDRYIGKGGGEGYQAEDELMERAYWGNQATTGVTYEN